MLLLIVLKKYNIIHKAGAWYQLTVPGTGELLEDADGKPVKLNGMSKVLDFLKLNPEYFKSIQDFILADIAGEDISEEDNLESAEEGESDSYTELE